MRQSITVCVCFTEHRNWQSALVWENTWKIAVLVIVGVLTTLLTENTPTFKKVQRTYPEMFYLCWSLLSFCSFWNKNWCTYNMKPCTSLMTSKPKQEPAPQPKNYEFDIYIRGRGHLSLEKNDSPKSSQTLPWEIGKAVLHLRVKIISYPAFKIQPLSRINSVGLNETKSKWAQRRW